MKLSKNNLTVITDDVIAKAIKDVGVCSGDTLLVHTEIFNFGIPVIDKKKYLESLCQILLKSVGQNGTIVMPTYTYSFCDSEIYDVQNSLSKMGVLNEYFRKNYAIRTLNPNFSHAIYDKNVSTLVNANPYDSFGKDSIFAMLHKLDAKMLCLGNWYIGWTFFHYIEKMANVSYCFDKNLLAG